MQSFGTNVSYVHCLIDTTNIDENRHKRSSSKEINERSADGLSELLLANGVRLPRGTMELMSNSDGRKNKTDLKIMLF